MAGIMGLVYWSMVPNWVFMQLPVYGGDCHLFDVIYSSCKVLQRGNGRRLRIAMNCSSQNYEFMLSMWSTDLTENWGHYMWGVVCWGRVSGAGTGGCIPQYLWDAIACPCPWGPASGTALPMSACNLGHLYSGDGLIPSRNLAIARSNLI